MAEVHAYLNFNSQPHREADILTQKAQNKEEYFNSQPHREADGIQSFIGTDDKRFQLTASQGG